MKTLLVFTFAFTTMTSFAQDPLSSNLDLIQQAINAAQPSRTQQDGAIAERYAQLVTELAEARGKENQEERLAALEAVLERYEIGQQAKAPDEPYIFQETQGKWGVDLLEETPGAGLSLYMALEASRGKGVSGNPVYLVLAKEAKKDLTIYIKWGSYFRQTPLVEYQWDTENWMPLDQVLSRSKQSTYLKEDTEGFIQRLRTHRRLNVRTVPFASKPLLCEFELEGFSYLYSQYVEYFTGLTE
jgi:hypothetical protein